MSAYVVEDQCINRIVTFLTDSRRTWERRQVEQALAEQGVIGDNFSEQLGNALFELNCNAVEQRYGDGEAREFRELNYAFRPAYAASLFQVYDEMRTWIYQCSEGDVPESSRLFQAISRVCDTMAHEFVRNFRDRR